MEHSQVKTAKGLLHDLAHGTPPQHSDWCHEKTRAGTVSECNCPFMTKIKKAINELRAVEKTNE